MLTLKEAVKYLKATHDRTILSGGLRQAIKHGNLKAVWNDTYRVWETTEEGLDEWHATSKRGAPKGNKNAAGNKGRRTNVKIVPTPTPREQKCGWRKGTVGRLY